MQDVRNNGSGTDSGRKHYNKSNRHYRHHHVYYEEYRDESSEMERRGENIIYRDMRKKKMSVMAKRTAFIVVVLCSFIFLIYAIINSDSESKNNIFTNNLHRTEEINELKIKIIDYEDYIEELEERLSKYEEVERKSFSENE